MQLFQITGRCGIESYMKATAYDFYYCLHILREHITPRNPVIHVTAKDCYSCYNLL